MPNKEYFYPLYKDEDQELFSLLRSTVNNSKTFELVGSDENFTRFMKLFVYSGKMKDYRQFWDILRDNVKQNKLNLPNIIKFGEKLEIQRGIDESWAIFTQDKRICMLLDEFYDADIRFDGTKDEQKELFLRFWLSQLLQDWRGPKLAIIIEALENRTIGIATLNKILAKWDFTGVFN